MNRLVIGTALTGAAILTTVTATAAATSHKTVKQTEIVVWHAQVDTAAKAMDRLVAKFAKVHPEIKVNAQLGSPGDEMVQKLQTVIDTDQRPDVAYVYGSDTPLVAESDKVVDISKDIKATGFDWNSLYDAGRKTATVGSKVVGFPAVIDNLAVVYNKKLFKAAGVAPPKASWTWNDYRSIAKKLTNAKSGQFGAAAPVAGTEDTVWRYWPMLWQLGGEALTSDLKKAAFNGPQGQKALQLLADMTLKDKSLFADQSPDTQKMYGSFWGGKLGMVVVGPWGLSDIQTHHIDYGVQVMPSFDGKNHETIAGPDNYVVFNNGNARRKAAVTFLAWLHEPAQDLEWDLATGQLPLSAKTVAVSGIATYEKKFPGISLFIANLKNAKHIRPPVPQYTEISGAVGKAIASALLGRSSVKDALNAAAKTADSALKG